MRNEFVILTYGSLKIFLALRWVYVSIGRVYFRGTIAKTFTTKVGDKEC